MARKSNARRFAQAIFEIAVAKKEIDRWKSDLNKIAELKTNTEAMVFLEDPKVRLEDKTRFVSRLFGDLNPLTINLVSLLVRKNNLGIVAEIAKEYEKLADEHYGIESAEVITAVPLDDSEKKKLEERLSVIIGKKVVMKLKVDPSLIGGVVARVGGKLLDASVQNQLDLFKKSLSGVESK